MCTLAQPSPNERLVSSLSQLLDVVHSSPSNAFPHPFDSQIPDAAFQNMHLALCPLLTPTHLFLFSSSMPPADVSHRRALFRGLVPPLLPLSPSYLPSPSPHLQWKKKKTSQGITRPLPAFVLTARHLFSQGPPSNSVIEREREKLIWGRRSRGFGLCFLLSCPQRSTPFLDLVDPPKEPSLLHRLVSYLSLPSNKEWREMLTSTLFNSRSILSNIYYLLLLLPSFLPPPKKNTPTLNSPFNV